MKFFLSVVLIAILCGAMEFILPWWSVAIASFLVSLFIAQKGGRAFLMGFAGVGLCWLVAALLHDMANAHILSVRMAQLFKLPNSWLFMMVTVIVGGLVGGLSAWAGSQMKTK